MNSFQRTILILLPLTPYLTNFPASDDTVSHWSVGAAVGLGQMADVSRNCDGKVLSVDNFQYTDVAGSVRYTNEPFTVAVTGGSSTAWMEYQVKNGLSSYPSYGKVTKPVPYCVPTVGIDTKYFGLEAGWLTTFGEGKSCTIGPHGELTEGEFPAGSIRFGNRDKLNFSIGMARNLPVFAGGGLFDIGLSTPIGESGSTVFLGIGGGQYDRPLISMKSELKMNDRFTLTPRIGLKAGDAFEYGLSIGGRIHF